MTFNRLVTAMFTPFTEENTIDFKHLEECIERLIRVNSDIVVSGTTAESPNLSHEEKLRLFKFTLEKVNKRVRVIAGTGSNNTEESMKLTIEAEKLGLDGVMLVAPYYNKPSQEGLFEHFKAISKSTELPIMVYNIPGRTGVNMHVDTMVRLTEIDNITCFKEASGDLNQISDLISKVPERIKVYSGDDGLTLPILAVGGYGVVSVASHIVGSEISEMIDAFYSGDVVRSLAIHQKLLPVFDGLFITSNPVALKYAMYLKGWCRPDVRLPLVELNEKEKGLTTYWMEDINLKT